MQLPLSLFTTIEMLLQKKAISLHLNVLHLRHLPDDFIQNNLQVHKYICEQERKQYIAVVTVRMLTKCQE
jgi:hypothetical protein